jgi:hypothetical protein
MSSQAGLGSTPSRAALKCLLNCERSRQDGNGDFRSQKLQKEVDFSNCPLFHPKTRGVVNVIVRRKLDDASKTVKDGESSEDLTEIFLSCLHTHFISVLEKRLSPSIVRSTPMDFIVTVPAIWSPSAKGATERAAAKAGFCGNQRISLISEPVSFVHAGWNLR